MPPHKAPDERFDALWTPDPDTGCHIWNGTTSGNGYGRFHEGNGSKKMVRAHIYAWVRVNGPVPDGLVLDHFHCDNPGCCNPEHVRPVTHRENCLRSSSPMARNARKTHCPQGHEYNSENIRWYDGRRYCRGCEKMRSRTRSSSPTGQNALQSQKPSRT